jgi:hypothetical protein
VLLVARVLQDDLGQSIIGLSVDAGGYLSESLHLLLPDLLFPYFLKLLFHWLFIALLGAKVLLFKCFEQAFLLFFRRLIINSLFMSCRLLDSESRPFSQLVDVVAQMVFQIVDVELFEFDGGGDL